MLYLIGFAIIFVIFFLISNFRIKKRIANQLLAIQNSWGKKKDAHFNFSLINLYNQNNSKPVFQQLSEQTLADIDFNELFQFIDRTTCNVGQQYLYSQLQRPTNDVSALKQLDKQVEFFALNKDTREQVQQLLLPLNNYDTYFIATLFNNNLLKKPWWQKWLGLNTILVLAMLIFVPFYKVLLIWLMLPFSINMFLHYFSRNGSYRFMRSIPQLNLLLNIGKYLQEVDIPFEKQSVNKCVYSLKKFQRHFLVQNFGQAKGDDFSQVLVFFVDLVKAFFLIEVRAFYKLMNEIQEHQLEIKQLFAYVGKIDMAISIASLRQSGVSICKPSFLDPKKSLSIRKVYHPLINQCVDNSINIHERSVLITGSNMSGKSSFLRTIAVNAILAQSLYTCFSEKFETPILKLHSSISIGDSLLDGKSYYFEEVTIIKKFINEALGDYQNLFLLDEVFKGTNTTERVAAAKAVLFFLNQKNNIVFVATHDIELSSLLFSEFDLYHFSENIENGELLFDHLLKTGPLQTRNAIKILEISGYPKSVIEEAKILAIDISKNTLELGFSG
jgi:DNA mismatch repair ATPase MutS